MSGPESERERGLLRSIGRRRLRRGLVVGPPMVAAWWLLSRWIAQRWNLQPDLVRFVVVFIMAVPGIFAPDLLGSRLTHDPRETPRLRWLNRERTERRVGRTRTILAVCLGMMLLMQCLAMLAPGAMNNAASSPDMVVWLVLTIAVSLRWGPADPDDEATQLRSLIAVNRAFVVTLLACLAAITLDTLRGGGVLHPALEAAMLVGCLTLQVSLIIGKPRIAGDET